MANVIKYNTGSVPANAIKSGNFDIGVNFGGYGSTSATNYYNGRTPNVSGYTIYQANGVSSPILYAAANDAELIVYSNQLGGSGNTTIGQALTYFRSSSTMTCVNVDYPNIVTSGLVLNSDAGFTPSYPRTGTSWTDISGSGNTGTLTNGVSYSGESGGSLVFDGTDDYVNIGPASKYLTSYHAYEAWIKTTGLGSNTVSGVISISYGLTINLLPGGNLQYAVYSNESSSYIINQNSSGVNLFDGQWHHIVCTRGVFDYGMYIDGVLNQSGSPGSWTGTNIWASMNALIGNNPNNVSLLYNGNIFNVKIYNRQLSVAEVLQNYYAGLQRLIPTDGLILYLDGNNTNKQVMTASTANDISGNNNTGTLTNGVTLSRDGQRSFSFDGVDDYINLGSPSSLILNNGGTISAWCKWDSYNGSSWSNTIIGKGGSGWAAHHYILFKASGTNKILFSVSDGSSYLNGSGPYTRDIPLNVWFYVTATWDSSVKKIYYNGNLESSVSSSIMPINSAADVSIGRTGNNGYYLDGNVGTIDLYDRALTQTEITTIYNATKSRYGL